MVEIILRSTLTCPACGHRATETMPVDACIVSYTCAGCDTELRPRGKECCVFCSHGDVRCPAMQALGGMGNRSSCCG